MSWNRTEGWHQYGILNFKGHPYHTGPDHRRFQKKERRRAQRRDNHKEIEAQFQDEHPIPMNIYAPVPVFLMDDWERAGMEYFRQMKSIFAMNRGRGLLAWKRQEMARRRYIDTDETLFETLQRSVNRS